MFGLCLRGEFEAEEFEGSGVDWGWPCQDGGGVGVAEANAIAGEVGEILQQGAEAVDGPSAVRLLAALRRAAGETLALATGEVRWAAAVAGSSSLNSIGASSRFMCQMT